MQGAAKSRFPRARDCAAAIAIATLLATPALPGAADAACAGCDEYTLDIPRPQPEPEPEPAPEYVPPAATVTPAVTEEPKRKRPGRKKDKPRRRAEQPQALEPGEPILVSESSAGAALWRNLGGLPGLALVGGLAAIGLAPRLSQRRR